jgi:CheY-like chemotaxis protein
VCLAPRTETELVGEIRDLICRWHETAQETRRLHSELQANFAEFQARLKSTIGAGRRFTIPASDGVVVLVADDEDTVRRFLANSLERAGCLVLEAADCKEAIRLLWDYSSSVRLVLLDWAMPGMTGLETVRTMRRVAPEARLLVCTGSPEDSILKALGGEPVEGILEKPFQASELVAEVARHLKRGPMVLSALGTHQRY